MPRKQKGRRVAKGITQFDDGSWQVRLRVGNAPLYKKTLPASFTRKDVRDHIEKKRRELRAYANVGPERGTFAHDVERYLLKLKHRPKLHAERTTQLALWVEKFGHRSRHAIRADDIAATLDAWTAAGFAASTVKHRRMALLRFYEALDVGLELPNPCAKVAPPREPEMDARGYDMSVVDAMLDVMSDQGGPGKRGEPRAERSKAKARARVLAKTGIRPEELQRHLPVDYNKLAKELFVRAAKGSEERTIPLFDDAIEALDAFYEANAVGSFSESNVRRALIRALDRLRGDTLRAHYLATTKSTTARIDAAKGEREVLEAIVAAGGQSDEWRHAADLLPLPRAVTTYELRHSFCGWLLEHTDLKTVQLYIGHKDERMTKRYAKRAVDVHLRNVRDRVQQAIAQVREKTGGRIIDFPGEKLPQKVTPAAK